MKEKANILRYLMGSATQKLVSVIFKVNHGLSIVKRQQQQKIVDGEAEKG